jgi:nicotinamidase-related amidase
MKREGGWQTGCRITAVRLILKDYFDWNKELMKNVLILVDVQNGFIHNAENQVMVQKIGQLVQEGLFDRTIATRYINTAGSNIIRLMGWTKLLTEEEQTIPDIVNDYVDYVYEKNIYSAYTDSLCQYLLQENDGKYPEQVFLAGLDLGCCVLETATDFFEAGVRPFVLTSYCSCAGGPEYFDAAILCLKHLIGNHHLISEECIQSSSQLDLIVEKATQNCPC